VAYTHQWANEKHSDSSDGDVIPIRKNIFFSLRAKREREGQWWRQCSGGRFIESDCKLDLERQTGARRKETRLVLCSMMRREARLSPMLAGTMMIDGERALSTGPGSAAVSDFSTLRGTSALRSQAT
jgi:hypothetical protein